jgi:hypothetical protein
MPKAAQEPQALQACGFVYLALLVGREYSLIARSPLMGEEWLLWVLLTNCGLLLLMLTLEYVL